VHFDSVVPRLHPEEVVNFSGVEKIAALRSANAAIKPHLKDERGSFDAINFAILRMKQ
jgi:hypothetical protein